MAFYERTDRFMHRGIVLILAIVWCFVTIATLWGGVLESIAGAPFLLLSGYGLLVGYRNRSIVRISPEGIYSEAGPMAYGGKPIFIQRHEIERVYTRWVETKRNKRRYKFLVAGVEHSNGMFWDLSEGGAQEHEVRKQAQQIRHALEWANRVEEIQGTPRRANWAVYKPFLLWSGGLAASLFWGLIVSKVF